MHSPQTLLPHLRVGQKKRLFAPTWRIDGNDKTLFAPTLKPGSALGAYMAAALVTIQVSLSRCTLTGGLGAEKILIALMTSGRKLKASREGSKCRIYGT